ncbi:MAG: hypothetical protein J1F01_06905 [Oscillospiraceae bacterium]|nr:hypothetical protein [Oscillospiraceae bacterium]
MKKLYAFFTICTLLLVTGICAHAADFDVVSTKLPRGEAYKEYSAQIEMKGGNEGYSFEYVSGSKPKGLEINSDGSVTGIPTSTGTFENMNVRITHTDGTSALVTFEMGVSRRPIIVIVTVSDDIILYDGEQHIATVECFDYYTGLPLEAELVPTVLYGNDKLEYAQEAGTYYIDVRPPEGCSIRKREGAEYIVIEYRTAQISVKDKYFKYIEGGIFEITDEDVTVTPPEAGYAVMYRKRGDAEYSSELPTEPGIYDVRVHTTNPNYETAYANALLTIAGTAYMNLGNSPAALIFSENIAETEKESKLDAFKSDPNRVFRDINYPKFNIPGINVDLDADKYTVIVRDIMNFKDPGLYAEGVGNIASEYTMEKVNGADDLYKVTYDVEDVDDLYRYVMVVRRIGDVDGNGYVNAIDANHLDKKKDEKPATVTEARVWDVTKEGTLNRADAAAIRYRFSTPLEAYYPWVN